MKARLFISVIVVILVSVTSAFPAVRPDLKAETEALEAELSLASKPAVYVVFDFSESNALIKAGGNLLKKIPISDVSSWGPKVSVKTHTLARKITVLFGPRRARVKPGDSKDEDSFKIDALEISDMPARYTLQMDDGTRLTVRPQADSLITKLLNFAGRIKDLFIRPWLTVYYKIRGRSFSAYELRMGPADARALYWSFLEGNGCVILPPA